ncbi:MAG: hypothetical protein KAW47_01425, partial [Thermoplasmatales archaeon]|nr:hypothetical protein [Thermoplasmatales archaeon]
MNDIKTVLRDVGAISIMVGVVTLVALAIPLFFGEYGTNSSFDALSPLILTSLVFFGIGFTLYYTSKKADPANFKSAMITAALGWLFISLIGSIP